MKLLVCGGREYADKEHLHEFLTDLILNEMREGKLHGQPILIHGDARGADRLAHGYGVENSMNVVRVPALWDVHGNKAGALRNFAMLELKPDIVVAFPGGAGTAHMVRIAKQAGVRVIVSPR
jgi:ABC-type hemin transport system substrate-binding protein